MIQLSEQSSKMTVFWTPFRKFRYLHLHFGISTSMEIFQKWMLDITVGQERIYVLADGILVMGYCEREYDAQKNHGGNFINLLTG